MLYHLRVSALFDDRLVCLYNNFENIIENSEYPACGVGGGGSILMKGTHRICLHTRTGLKLMQNMSYS